MSGFVDESFSSGAAGSTLSGTTPDTTATGSGTWLLGFGSNVGKKTGAGALYCDTPSASSHGYYYTVDVTSPTHKAHLWFVRKDAPSNTFVVGPQLHCDASLGANTLADSGYAVRYDTGSGAYELQKRESGANVTLDSFVAALPTVGQEYKLTVEFVSGGTIKGYLDDVEILSATDPSNKWPSTGEAGFIVLDFNGSSTTGIHLNRFNVEEVAAGSAIAPRKPLQIIAPQRPAQRYDHTRYGAQIFAAAGSAVVDSTPSRNQAVDIFQLHPAYARDLALRHWFARNGFIQIQALSSVTPTVVPETVVESSDDLIKYL